MVATAPTRIYYNNILDARRYTKDVTSDEVTIGRAEDNDIVLNNPHVAEYAATLSRERRVWTLEPLSYAGCRVGDREIRPGQKIKIEGAVPIHIFPFTLSLESDEDQNLSQAALKQRLEEDCAKVLRAIHVELLKRLDLNVVGDERAKSERYVDNLEKTLDEIARDNGLTSKRMPRLVTHVASLTVRGELLQLAVGRDEKAPPELRAGETGWTRLVTAIPEWENQLNALVRELTQSLGLAEVKHVADKLSLVDSQYDDAWAKVAGTLAEQLREYLSLRYVKKQIKDIVFGYGPLEDLIRMPTVSEIMVTDRDHIYIESGGIIQNSGRRFLSDDVTLSIIERIVSRVGRRIDKSQPLVDARLVDGSRVNAIIPPLAISGPCITIRKFPSRKIGIDDLVKEPIAALTEAAVRFLRACVIMKKNILISGGTGSGKTTMLNCLSDFIPDRERIVTIEDTAELQLKKEHVVRLETKQANVEGAGEYTIRDLVKNALRMRPDRVVIGECRGAEALDMLQAMNTGHSGSLTTIHANTAEDVVLRLEVLVQMAADLPISSIHRQIASAIDLVIQLGRLKSGRRVVTQITEYADVDTDKGGIRTRDIFRMVQIGNKSELRPTGSLPTFMDELLRSGEIELETLYL